MTQHTNPRHCIGPFTLGKTISSTKGHEGETCLRGTLLKDGKKVAEWQEDSWGGGMHLTYASEAVGKEIMAETAKHPIAVDFEADFRKAYPESANNQAKFPGQYIDLVIGTIAQEIDQQNRLERTLKRWCKTMIVLRDPNAKEGEFDTISRQYAPSLDAALLERYPGMEIVNKRFL